MKHLSLQFHLQMARQFLKTLTMIFKERFLNHTAIAKSHTMKILVAKTKTMAFKGKEPIWIEIALYNKIIEQVLDFKFLEYDTSFYINKDLIKKNAQNSMYLLFLKLNFEKQNTYKEAQLKLYKVSRHQQFYINQTLGSLTPLS